MKTRRKAEPTRGGSRRRLPAAVAAVLVVLAAACPATAGWIEDRDGKTIIHVKLWALPDATRTDTYTRAEVAGVKEFVRRFPKIFAAKYRDKYKADPARYGRHNWDNVEVELHKFSGIVVEGVEVDLLAIAGKVAPDVLYVNFRKSDNYIQAGFLYPLDKPEDGYLTDMTEQEKDFRINRKIWPVIRRKGPGGEKQVWAIPYGGALGKVLLYRKDLFESAGVPLPDSNWTWQKLYEACRKIADPGKGIYGMKLGRGKHESWFWVTFLWSAGGEAMEYDEKKDQWRCVFDTREATVALDFYTRLSAEPWLDAAGKQRRGYTAKDVAGSNQRWDEGKIAMMMAYIDEKLFSTINPDVTGMAPVPLGPTGKRGGELNSRMMGMYAGVTDPIIRDAAWEYMKWYDCEDAVRLKTRVLVEGGLGKFVNPKYLKMFGYPEVIRLAPKGWSEVFEIAIETGRPEPHGRNSNVAYDLMTYPLQDAEQLALAEKLPPYDLPPGENVFDLYRRYINDEASNPRLDLLRGMLVGANARANEEMIGIIPPRERLIRRIVAGIVLLAIVVAFVFVFRKIVKAFTPPADPGGRKIGWGFRKYKWAYILLLPAVLSVFIWQYVPLLRGSVMAFLDYRIMGDSTLVWLDNFGDGLWSMDWWPRGKILFRTLFYLPAVIAGLVVILLWKSFYEPSEYGALNRVLQSVPAFVFPIAGAALLAVALAFAMRLFRHGTAWLGVLFVIAGVVLLYTCVSLAKPILWPGNAKPLWEMIGTLDFACTSTKAWYVRLVDRMPEAYRWLSDPDTAMFCLVLPMVWAGMGPGCLIYLAALKGISDDYYEAADIDGASFIDKILFVVFPMLKALIIINFIGVFIGSWRATANVLAMTGGAAKTETAGLHIFYKAFMYLKFGPATALAWFLGFMLIGFTVHQLRILSRLEFRTTGDTK